MILKLKDKEIEITKEELAELNKQAESVSEVWKPKIGEIYHYADSRGNIYWDRWIDSVNDNFLYYIGNCFKTREEAQKSVDRQQALARVKAYIRDNDLGLVPDWSDDGQNKFYITYCHNDKEFQGWCNSYGQRETEIGYLKSSEDCNQVIENMKEDLLLIFNVK